MNRVQLSAAAWDTTEKAHADLAQALNFPDYYGHNLDALHDCLTELTDTQLVITDCAVASGKILNLQNDELSRPAPEWYQSQMPTPWSAA